MTHQTQQQGQKGMNETGNEKRFKVAYTVGVKPDGTLVFEWLGDEIGVIELLGLHRFAEHRLKRILDNNEGTGDAISLEILKFVRGENPRVVSGKVVNATSNEENQVDPGE